MNSHTIAYCLIKSFMMEIEKEIGCDVEQNSQKKREKNSANISICRY